MGRGLGKRLAQFNPWRPVPLRGSRHGGQGMTFQAEEPNLLIGKDLRYGSDFQPEVHGRIIGVSTLNFPRIMEIFAEREK